MRLRPALTGEAARTALCWAEMLRASGLTERMGAARRRFQELREEASGVFSSGGTAEEKKRAEALVEDFRQMLDEETANRIGSENFDALAMLIESAITTTAVDTTERIAEKISGLVAEVRNSAENYQGE